ncbi:transmembrane protein 238a [Polypterus senegalus]|nr:transmembrane protein 238a [Polypterus senegalus]
MIGRERIFNRADHNQHREATNRAYAVMPCHGLSHCKLALLFAVLMDILGVAALLIGVFAPLEIGGKDFGDLLVYSGSILVFISLLGWVFWYSGNIEGLETSDRQLWPKRGAIERLTRTLSRRMSSPKSRPDTISLTRRE